MVDHRIAPMPMGDVLVLCYHAISDSWPNRYSISLGRLAEQLEFLVERGYRSATFADAVIAPPHRKTLVITFDDGYRSVLQARPILARLGLVGTVFVVTNWPDRNAPMDWPSNDHWLGGSHEHELMPLSWQDLRSLRDEGWEIGAHSCSHPNLRTLDDRRLADELTASRRACEEHLAQPCVSVAYPYGEVDARVINAARIAGYSAGAAMTWRLRRAGQLEHPRVGISRNDTFEYWQQRVAPIKRRLVGSFAGDGLLLLDRRLRKPSEA